MVGLAEDSLSLDGIKLRVVLAALLDLEGEPFGGRIFRAAAAELPALQGSSAGRWAGPGVDVLQASTSAEGAVRELMECLAAGDALAAARKYAMHEISVSLRRVVRLTRAARLQRLGVPASFMAGQDYESTQRVAGAAFQLGIEGLLVPAAAGQDPCLVLFRDRLAPNALCVASSWRLSPIELRRQRLGSPHA